MLYLSRAQQRYVMQLITAQGHSLVTVATAVGCPLPVLVARLAGSLPWRGEEVQHLARFLGVPPLHEL